MIIIVIPRLLCTIVVLLTNCRKKRAAIFRKKFAKIAAINTDS